MPAGVLYDDQTCCPISLGEVCWVNGALSGRAFAVLNPTTNVITYTDKAGAGVIAAGLIVVCRTTSYAHMFDVLPALAWTPAQIPAGRILTAVSMVVLSGTATVADQDNTVVATLPTGYSTSWDSAVDGVLSPPISITAAVASRVMVTMVCR